MIGKLFAGTLAKVSAGIVAGLLAALVWCWIGWSRDDRRADEQQEARVKAEAALDLLQTDGAIRELADKRREADRAGINLMEQQYAEAIEEVVDSAPDASGIGFERLRRSATPGVLWILRSAPSPFRPPRSSPVQRLQLITMLPWKHGARQVGRRSVGYAVGRRAMAPLWRVLIDPF